MYQAPPRLRRTNDVMVRLIYDLSPVLARIRTDMGYGADSSPGLGFLRHLHRYLLFKAEWYYGGGMPHCLARFDHNALAHWLERLFLGSHKIEHYRVWFRDQLFDYVQETLGDRRTASRPYLNRRSYAALVESHRRRSRNYVDEISKLVTLELIHQTLIECDYLSAARQRPLNRMLPGVGGT
jgi:hypothetical protein